MDEPKGSDIPMEEKPVILDEPARTEAQVEAPGVSREEAAEYTAMFRVAAWAKTFSWLILVIGGGYVLLNLYRFARSVASAGALSQVPLPDLLSGSLGVLYSILQVGFFFLVLQGISELIDFVIDRWL